MSILDRLAIFKRLSERGFTVVVGSREDLIISALCDEFEAAFEKLLERAPYELLEAASVNLATRADKAKQTESQNIQPPPMPVPEPGPRTIRFSIANNGVHVEVIRVFWVGLGATDVEHNYAFIQAQVPRNQYNACVQFALDNNWRPVA